MGIKTISINISVFQSTNWRVWERENLDKITKEKLQEKN